MDQILHKMQREKKSMTQILNNREILDIISSNLCIEDASQFASTCRDLKDTDMTRRYSAKLTHSDRKMYTEHCEYFKEEQHPDFLQWKFKSTLDEIPAYAKEPRHISRLHMALLSETTPALVLNLVKCNIEALEVQDIYGNTPLSLAIIHKFPQDVILSILSSCRAAAAYPNKDGNFPLHLAFIHESSSNVANEILKCFREAAKKQNHENHFAIMLACSYSASNSIIDTLLSEFPDLVKKSCFYVLYCFMQYKSSSQETDPCTHDIVKRMIKYGNIDSPNDFTEYAWSIITVAIYYVEDYDIFETIMRTYSIGASLKSSDYHPLHNAIMKKRDIKIIRLLYDAYPRALREKVVHSNYTEYAIHMAVEHNSAPEIIQFLIDQHKPSTRFISEKPYRDEHGHYTMKKMQTPAGLALELGNSEALMILMRADPRATQQSRLEK